uniref:PAP_fibrillin domain-containing protein n=1 Tax=Haemonchus contortus TaxID=6289 RepID=A0A7I4YVJ9_HAECO
MSLCSLLVLALLSNSVLCADVVEGMLRNVLLSIRGVGERVLSNIAIPTSKDLVHTPAIGFQVDHKSAHALKSLGEFLNTCPPALPPPPLTGKWIVTYASKKWLQTTMADLDEAIDLLANNQNVPETKPLSTIFRPEVSISCLKLEFAPQGNGVKSAFEISYLKNKKKSSLIGELAALADKSLHMVFLPSLSIYMVVVYTTATVNETPFDVIVLSETSTFPKCDNFLILQRSQQSSRIFQITSAMGANFPSNPLHQIQCEDDGDGRVVIRPAGISGG